MAEIKYNGNRTMNTYSLKDQRLAEFDQIVKTLMLKKYEKDMPWYDSVWLHRFLVAQQLIQQVQPTKVADFIHAFNPLRTDPNFEIQQVKETFNFKILQKIKNIIASLPTDTHERHEIDRFGRLIVHDHLFFSELQRSLVQIVSELAGEDVEPSYNFLSLYSGFGVCEPHIDAPSAKWTLDICIDQSDEWPINFSQIVPWPDSPVYSHKDWQTQIKKSPSLNFSSYTLKPNEALLFSGSSQWHYRDAVLDSSPDRFCHLLFLHYIPVGMSKIVDPKNWADIFDIPELAGLGFSDPRLAFESG